MLVIHGAKDKHLDVLKMERFVLEKFGSGVSEFHVLDEAGHMPFYESPEETKRLILDFVRRGHAKGGCYTP